ncbi:hypothetical protein MHYP_G00170400 [Metynnis hypsauchen]
MRGGQTHEGQSQNSNQIKAKIPERRIQRQKNEKTVLNTTRNQTETRLLGTIRLCLLHRTLADLRSVHPGENITLRCDITADYEISWYQLSSEEMKLKVLITAERGELDKSFSLSHNMNEGHYEGTEDTRSVSLVIIGVNESDLGLYYCGGRNITASIQFGKAVGLTFEDVDYQSNGSPAQSDSEPPPDYNDNPLHWIIIIVLTSVCLVQISVISLCAFCHRVKGERCSDLPSTEKISETLLQKEVLQSGLHHSAVTTGASEGHKASALDIMTQTYPQYTSGPFTAVIFEVLHQK